MFQKLFRSKPSETRDDPFHKWQPLESLPITSSLPGVFDHPPLQLASANSTPLSSSAVPPAIVIGLGGAGEIILKGWQKRINESGYQTNSLRGLWLYHSEQNLASIPSSDILTRQINLHDGGGSAAYHSQSSREAMHTCMNQAVVYDKLKEYLVRDAQDLSGRIRVFIAASVREPIIGIIGDILQLLTILRSDRSLNFNITITCVLTLDGTEDAVTLSDAEVFAVVREVSRLSFKGIHVMPPAVSEHSGILRQEGLEYLFLVEPPMQSSPSQPVPFHLGTAEIAAETIYALTDPSSTEIWNDLVNRLTAGANVKDTLQTPLVYAANSTALYNPLALLQEYASLRLMHALFYGEKTGSGEGLVKANAKATSAESLASGWLTQAPNEHPFFSWLLKARHDPRPVPPLSSGQAASQALKNRLCDQLNKYLNQPDGDLELACQALEWLNTLHAEIASQLSKTPSGSKNTSALQHMQALNTYLAEAQDILSRVSQELQAWCSVFNLHPEPGGGETGRPAAALTEERGKISNPFEAGSYQSSVKNPFESQPSAPSAAVKNPFAAGQPPVNPFEDGKDQSEAAGQNLVTFKVPDLLEQSKLAYQALVDAGNAPVSRSVLQLTAGRDEIEHVYRSVIRPELNQATSPSPFFTPVRSRLGWWVNVDSISGRVRIYGVALPASWQPDHQQRLKASYPVQRAAEFFNQVRELCLLELRNLKRKFSDQIFLQSALEKKDFLRQAGERCIRYQSQLVANDRMRSPETAQVYGYLFYKPAEIPQTINFREHAFDSLERSNVSDIFWNISRVVALQIMTNLPAWRIEMLSRAQARYRSAMFRHLYNHERNAFDYERRAQNELSKEILLTPRTCMLMADIELVHIFLQAFLAQLVRPTSDKKGIAARDVWAVVDVPMPGAQAGEVYPPLFLDAYDKSALGLWEALESFALKLPNRPLHEVSPADPFHRDERLRYLPALQSVTRSRLRQPEIREWRKELRKTLLAELDQSAAVDPLAGDLACLIRIELNSLI